MSENLVIYAGGSLATNFTPLMNSGFTTLIVNSLHFNADRTLNIGDITYVGSDGRPTAAATRLGQIITQLRQRGGFERVLVSVGGGGEFKADPQGINGLHSVSDSDFKNFSGFYWGAVGMTSSLSNYIPILRSFSNLLDALGADGIDLDPEPMFYTYEALASTTLILTEWAALTEGKLATWVPYQAQSSWQAMAQLLTAGSDVTLSWINLQPPAWNNGSDIRSWAVSLGVREQAMVPGFDGDPPAAIQQALAQVVNSGFAIQGAYFWNYDDIVNQDVSAYAAAMRKGLAGDSGTGK